MVISIPPCTSPCVMVLQAQVAYNASSRRDSNSIQFEALARQSYFVIFEGFWSWTCGMTDVVVRAQSACPSPSPPPPPSPAPLPSACAAQIYLSKEELMAGTKSFTANTCNTYTLITSPDRKFFIIFLQPFECARFVHMRVSFPGGAGNFWRSSRVWAFSDCHESGDSYRTSDEVSIYIYVMAASAVLCAACLWSCKLSQA